MSHLLQVTNLTVEFDSDDGVVHAVNQVSFHLDAGEALGLVGESGCGKSVTSMSIPRLVPSPPGRRVSGQIEFAGRDLTTLPLPELRKLRGQEIGVIFQEPMTALSPLHRIGEQLDEVIRLHRDQPAPERRALWLDWLRRVGIADAERCAKAYPFELSGGMRQRVMIAMAMLLEPQLVIADEPTTALDVTIQAQILDLLHQVTEDSAKPRALLLITHDLGVIWEMCTRVIVMYGSRIMEEAPAQELFNHPLHPYSQGLLASIPSLQNDPKKLSSIPGTVPSLLNPPSGCPFAPRCPKATDVCRNTLPPRRETAIGHFVACHQVEGVR
jgi:oligopeptide/dipeptide ABC transporter ATP-binding protein